MNNYFKRLDDFIPQTTFESENYDCCENVNTFVDIYSSLEICRNCGTSIDIIMYRESAKELDERLTRNIRTSKVKPKDQRYYRTLRMIRAMDIIPDHLVEQLSYMYKKFDDKLNMINPRPRMNRKQVIRKLLFENYKLNDCKESYHIYKKIAPIKKLNQRKKFDRKWKKINQ